MDEKEIDAVARQANTWIREATEAMSMRQFDRARELFLKVIGVAPAFSDAHYNLGVICDLEKNPGQAVKYYEEALKRDPNHARALTNLGAAHSNAGRFKIALPFFHRAIAADPNLIQPRINLGITHRHLEEPGHALEALKGALGIEPGNGYVLYLAGCAAQEAGIHVEAERLLSAALRIRPNYTDALIVLVDVLLELESPERAVEVLETFIRDNPNSEPAAECLRRIKAAGPERY